MQDIFTNNICADVENNQSALSSTLFFFYTFALASRNSGRSFKKKIFKLNKKAVILHSDFYRI